MCKMLFFPHRNSRAMCLWRWRQCCWFLCVEQTPVSKLLFLWQRGHAAGVFLVSGFWQRGEGQAASQEGAVSLVPPQQALLPYELRQWLWHEAKLPSLSSGALTEFSFFRSLPLLVVHGLHVLHGTFYTTAIKPYLGSAELEAEMANRTLSLTGTGTASSCQP